MDSESFKARRWTLGNFLFPTVIEITDKAVIRHKRRLLSKDEVSISIARIASVHIKTGFLWSNIRIESFGGVAPLKIRGFAKADAQQIRRLLEESQEEEIDLGGGDKLILP